MEIFNYLCIIGCWSITHVGHGKKKQIWLLCGRFFNPYFPLFLLQTKVGKGEMYIQVNLYHCAFYQYNHCFINSYLDEDSTPTIVPIIKVLNREVGLQGKT